MQLEFFGAAGEVAGSCHGGFSAHGEMCAATALRDAFHGQGVAAEVSRPGLRTDLGSPAHVRG